MIDTDAIRRIPISQVIGRYIQITKNGKHYDAICPFHNDTKTGNFKITDSKGIYNCFVCGVHGDAIEFVRMHKFNHLQNDEGFIKACEEITGMKLKEVNMPPEKKVIQINPVPEGVGLPRNLGNKHWIYRNPDGSIYGIVKRVDKDGKKEIYPMIYTAEGWQTKGFQGKIPLYGIHNKSIQSTALIVEGEKTADYLQSVLPDKLVVTWQGGTNATMSKIDWDELTGLDIVMFPDNDATGFKAMHKIRETLGNKVGSVKWVNPPIDSPAAWDVADSGYDKTAMVDYIRKNITDYTGLEVYTPFIETAPDSGSAYDDNSKPFIPLGFTVSDDGSQKFVLYVKASKVILHVSAQSLSGNNLLTLAPANFWQMNFPGTKGGIDSFAAANFIIECCSSLGKYDPDMLRGRGAWRDNGRVIFHAGKKLFINGIETPLGKPIGSEYVYESGVDLKINIDNPLSANEAKRIFEVTDLINWGGKNDSMLFAGWHFIAPVGGVLNWRPHLVITGQSGSGKSWVASQSKTLMGKMLIVTAGSTTEAAIRQLLGIDALPLIFEEIDTDTRDGEDRVKNIVTLMRNSSQDGQAVYKGSTSGDAKKFLVRSCFGIIGVGVVQDKETDTNRVTILNLLKYEDNGNADEENPHFVKLKMKVAEIFTPSWVERFIARSIVMIPVTLKNIETFNLAAMPFFKGRQRENDQLSAILGGWWTIFNDRHVTIKEATDILKSKGFSVGKDKTKTPHDSHDKLLELLLWSKLRYENDNKTLERTVLELIIETCSYTGSRKCTAHEALNRNGFRIIDDEFIISNSHQNIKKILENTEWSINHNKFLLRIKGARATETIYFKGQVKSSAAVALPLRDIIHMKGDAWEPDENEDNGDLPF